MWGFICSIISGALMSIQGVFNTRLSDKIGLWETNAFVQGTGFLITLIIVFFWGNGNIKGIVEANKLYLISGALGVGIIFTVMKGIGSLGATCAIGAILISQLLVAAIIDAFGLFGCEKITFGLSKYIGVAAMIAGVIIFKSKF